MTVYTFQDGQLIEVPTELDDYPYYRDIVLRRTFEEMSLLNPNNESSEWVDITSPDWWLSEKFYVGDKNPMVWMGTYWRMPTVFDTKTGLLAKSWARKRFLTAIRFTIQTTQPIDFYLYSKDEESAIETCSYYKGGIISLEPTIEYDYIFSFKIFFKSTQDANLRVTRIEAMFTDRQKVSHEMTTYPEIVNFPLNQGNFCKFYSNDTLLFYGNFYDSTLTTQYERLYLLENNNEWKFFEVEDLAPADCEGTMALNQANFGDQVSFTAKYNHINETDNVLRFFYYENLEWHNELVYQGTSYNRATGQVKNFTLPNGEFVIIIFDAYVYVNTYWIYKRATNGVWTLNQIYSYGGSGSEDPINCYVDINGSYHILHQSGTIFKHLTNTTGSWVSTNIHTSIISNWGERFADLYIIDNVPHFFYQENGLYYKKKVSGSWTSGVKILDDFQRTFMAIAYTTTSFYLMILEKEFLKYFNCLYRFNKSTMALEDIKMIPEFLPYPNYYIGWALTATSEISTHINVTKFTNQYGQSLYTIQPLKIRLNL